MVVMEAGKVAETGPVATLLHDADSWFSRLVDMSGPEEAANLRAIADAHFAAAAVAAAGPLVAGSA